MFRSIVIAAALGVLVVPALSSTACAGDRGDDGASVQHRVYLPHVDFGDPVQVGAVYHRLKSEAHDVCDQAATYNTTYSTRGERDCEAQALAGAVRDINQTQLSALYDEQHSKAPVQLGFNSPRR